MPTREDVRICRDPRIPFQEIQGQAIIVVPARRELHQLDETATFLWSALKESRSVRELSESLCREFDVDAERAERDVRDFVASLEEKGLVVRG